VREASCQVKAAAVIGVEMAERAWEAIMGKLRAAETVASCSWAEAERLKQAPEMRGQDVRWLVHIRRSVKADLIQPRIIISAVDAD